MRKTETKSLGIQNNLESQGPKNVPCQIEMHSGQWFMRRLLRNFAI